MTGREARAASTITDILTAPAGGHSGTATRGQQ